MKILSIPAALIALTALTFGLTSVDSASAQSQGPAIRNGDNGTPAIYRHASTLEEGFFRGLADLGRGVGDYNYNTSLAMINVQEAQRRSIENRVARVESLYEIKRQNREWKKYNRRIVTREQATAVSNARMPVGLSERNYDAEVGRLFWPESLTDVSYDAERAVINDLVRREGVKTYQVRQAAKQLTAKLKDNIAAMDPMDYIVAKRFLSSLEAEAVLPSR